MEETVFGRPRSPSPLNSDWDTDGEKTLEQERLNKLQKEQEARNRNQLRKTEERQNVSKNTGQRTEPTDDGIGAIRPRSSRYYNSYSDPVQRSKPNRKHKQSELSSDTDRVQRSKPKRNKKQSAVSSDSESEPKKKQPRKKPANITTRFKREKNVKPENQKSQRNFSSVKMKLRTVLNKDYKRIEELIDLIVEHSIKTTRIASLATLLLLGKINDYLHDKHFFQLDPDLVVKDVFYEVLGKRRVQGKRYVSPFPQYYKNICCFNCKKQYKSSVE